MHSELRCEQFRHWVRKLHSAGQLTTANHKWIWKCQAVDLYAQVRPPGGFAINLCNSGTMVCDTISCAVSIGP